MQRLDVIAFSDWHRSQWFLYAQVSAVKKPTISLLCSLNGRYRVMVDDKVVEETCVKSIAIDAYNERIY